MYSEKVYELYDNLKNCGRVKYAEEIHQYEDENTHDVVKIFLAIENETITNAKFKMCGSIASMIIADYAMELLYGLTLSEAKAITVEQITDNFANIRDLDTYSAVTMVNAIQSAIEDYEEKQRKLLIKQLREQGLPIPEELKK